MKHKKERIKALKNCEDHWNWLAENPERKKYEYFKISKKPRVAFYCYCCQFSAKHKDIYCGKSCIINWNTSNGCLSDIVNTLYSLYLDASTNYLKSSYAKQIAIKAKIARQIIEEGWPK